MTGRIFAVKIKILSDKECEITICEGKYHQIKRMFCAVGNEVTNLRRIKMGRLFLDERLRDGECREITADELKMISEKNKLMRYSQSSLYGSFFDVKEQDALR